jgi:predicted acyl esterase
MKFTLFTTAALLLMVSCGKDTDQAGKHNSALKQFEQNVQSSMNFAFRPKYPKPNKINPKTFAKNFCNFVSATPNPFELEKHIVGDQSLQMLSGQLGYLGQNNLSCAYSKEIYDHYPLQLVEYKTSIGYNIYVHYMYDQNYKVSQTSISLQATDLHVDHLKIPMTDGKALSTFLFKNSEEPKGTILIRTPYYHTGPMYLSIADSFLRKGYNVAIQSNRGSHLSDGEFRWLSKDNSKDAYDTIEFLAKQTFSNGKVVSYGVSYDGFNALASGIDNPPSLAGIIACSAPANAATDSFTANTTPEAYLLSYIWERETNSPIKFFMQKYLYLKSKGIAAKDYDNEIFGRDVGDWDDFLADNKKYYEDRNLLPGLNKINVPTIHVAGLSNDQDGRDTILAYESLQANAVNKDLHRLLLHESGHGCGSFEQGSEFDKYLQLSSDAPPIITGSKVRQYSKTLQGYAAGDSYPLTDDFQESALPLTSSIDNLHQQLNPADFTELPVGYFLDSLQEITQSYTQNGFIFPVTEKIQLSGTPKIKIKAMVTAPETAIYVDVYVIRPDGSTKTLNNVQRSGIVWNKTLNTVEEVEITLPPTLETISAESQIYIQLSSKKSWVIQPTSDAREQFFQTQSYGHVVIFAGSEFILPVEKDILATSNSVSTL